MSMKFVSVIIFFFFSNYQVHEAVGRSLSLKSPEEKEGRQNEYYRIHFLFYQNFMEFINISFVFITLYDYELPLTSVSVKYIRFC